jgi:D-glycero-D-manno-heptose 1,7-bisphosphate phosphatase
MTATVTSREAASHARTAGGRRAVFLDRDGTLTDPRHYPTHPEDLVLHPGIGPPLRALQEEEIALVVVTNQSALARGLLRESALAAMHQHLRELLARQGVQLDGIYVCAHHPDGAVARFRRSCDCRKPAPGMLHQAATDLALDLTQSWMIGDSACDIEAGRRAGTHTALAAPAPLPDIAPDLYAPTTTRALAAIHQSLLVETVRT